MTTRLFVVVLCAAAVAFAMPYRQPNCNTSAHYALVQTLAPKSEEQTYVYLRDAGKNFHVLIVTIEKNEATVVQATVAPQVLADLLKTPDEMGKALTDEATISDP